MSEFALHGSTDPLGYNTRVVPGAHPPYRSLDIAAEGRTTVAGSIPPNTARHVSAKKSASISNPGEKGTRRALARLVKPDFAHALPEPRTIVVRERGGDGRGVERGDARGVVRVHARTLERRANHRGQSREVERRV